MPKYQCPDCHAVLRRAEAIPAGKKIRCPKCESVFPAKAMAEEEVPAQEPAAGYAVAGAAPPAKPKPALDEEENSLPYGVIKESGEDVKPEIHLGSLRDRFAKSKIGPAMFKTVLPSNWLLRLGLFSCAVAVFMFIFGAWPIIFCEATPLRPFIRPRVDIMIRATFMFTFGSIMCLGASKMHDLTSYTWSIIGSTMALLIYVPGGILLFLFLILILGPCFTAMIVSVPFMVTVTGIWCLITLMNPKVREGFKERAEELEGF
jgi:hypothetical protein